MRTIYISAVDKHVSLGNYVRAIKKAKANPNAQFEHGLTTWASCYGYEIVRQYMRGMMDRINQGVSYAKRGAA